MLTRLFKQGLDFKCIGNKCIDSCCTGWDITFDKKTYDMLSHDTSYKKTMTDYATVNDNIAIETINYGIVSLTADNRCPFLDSDDLCNVQKKRGEKELSNVCALYPRYYNTLDGVYEESLSLACIEATEKLLFRGLLVITEIERGPKREVILQTVDTKVDNGHTSGIKYISDFRKVIFEFMRNDKTSFNDKLSMLMTFHESIEGMTENELKLTLKSYDFSKIDTTIAFDEALYKRLIDFLRLIGESEHSELDILINSCIKESRYERLALDKLSQIDGIMSNYIIHQMFKDLYPFIPHHSKKDSFLYLLKKIQILRLLIAFDGHFGEKRVARIIQMYSKGLEHHGNFYYELDTLIL